MGLPGKERPPVPAKEPRAKTDSGANIADAGSSANRNGNNDEFGHVRILPLASLKPSPVNNQVYRPVSSGDPQ